jgi:putative ABC transport system permease protein
MAYYLAFKEVWYHKGRYLLISMIVALITTLVLFIAALAEGLGSGNREYLEKLNGELIVYQSGVDLSVSASRFGRSRLAAIRRVEGVEEVGHVGVASASLVFTGDQEPVDVSLIGVEPGMPGEPPVRQGRNLGRSRANEVLIDQRVVDRTQLQVGDTITVKAIQGTQEKYFDLTVVGASDGRGLFLQPTIFVPFLTWDKIRPQGEQAGNGELIGNIVVVKLEQPEAWQQMAVRLEEQVSDIQVVDRVTAYEATPGYSAQQSTLDTQRYFTFLIGLLVIGGFFQIQTLQKVAQIGMLKAVGASTATIALGAIIQIVALNALGVAIGTLGSLALSVAFPPTVPIVFTGNSVVAATTALLVIGPMGGMVSVWLLLRVEPLTALGLAQ